LLRDNQINELVKDFNWRIKWRDQNKTVTSPKEYVDRSGMVQLAKVV